LGDDREWVEGVLRHEDHWGVPYHFDFTPPVARALASAFGGEDLEAVLNLPIRTEGCVSIKPLYADPKVFGECAEDEFGVVWKTNAMDRGTPIAGCLPEADLAAYRFPEARDEYRFERLGDWCRRSRGRYRILWVGDLWERATFMRGMEQALLDVALHPAFVEELLGKLTHYILETMEVLFERFTFECIALSDDYGSQRGLVMSPQDWRRLIKPRLAEIYAFAKTHGRRVMHHTCGNVREIVGEMIDVGLDILHPVQPEAMDVVELKREFGTDLTLCGGVGTQKLLRAGTVEQVRREVRRLKRELGKGGGYILAPGITVQADAPLELVTAMIEEAVKDRERRG